MARKKRRIEEQIEEQTVLDAEADGWIARKTVYLERRGCLDHMFYKQGRILFIEFKKPGGILSGLQKKEIRLMKANDVECHVVDSVEQGHRILGID